jgi:inositol oxygenase
MHLVGLLHDLGKVLAHPAFGSQPQWAVVGDTFPTGITPEPCVVYHELFDGNPDLQDSRFQGPCGAYSAGCGLDKVRMSWGHDEYGYRVRWDAPGTQPWPGRCTAEDDETAAPRSTMVASFCDAVASSLVH